MEFYLGIQTVPWLGKIDLPMMVSWRRMPKHKLPRAMGPWMLDSGGFTELNLYNKWTMSAKEYAPLIGCVNRSCWRKQD
jgi:hypothetical protein